MRKPPRSPDLARRPPADLAFWEAAFQSSEDGLARLSPEGIVLDINPSGASALRGEGAGPVIGRAWPAFWHEEDRPALQAAVLKAAAGETVTVSARMAGSSDGPPGRPSWWRATLSRVPGSGGAPESLLVVCRDTTGQQAAEQASRRSAKLTQALVEAISEIVWHYDLSTGLTERRGWTAFTGCPHDPELAEGWLDMIHPEDRDFARSETDRAMAAHRPLTIEYRLRHHSGTWRWVEDHATPLIGEDGQPSDWIGILTDIHDRKMAEQELRRSEGRLRLALDAAALGCWELDLRTGEREWSAEARRMIGVAPGVPILERTILDHTHPDDRDSIVAQRQLTHAHAAGTAAMSFRVLRPDTGETRWIAVRSHAVLDERGRPIRRVGTFQDITERRQVKETLRSMVRRYEALLQATSVIVWNSDAGQTRSERHGWAAFTGQSDEEARQEGWLAMVHPDDRPAVEADRRQALASGLAYETSYRLHHAGHGWRWVNDQVVPLPDEQGGLAEWVGIISDTHDGRSAEQALRTSEERLRLAIEATGLGTWDVDLRTGERQWSDEQRRLFGLAPGKPANEDSLFACLHPDDRASVLDHFDAMARSYPGSVSNTIRVVRADTGQVRWIRSQGRLVQDHEGRPIRRIGTCQDVTEQQETRQALQVALRRQKALIDATAAIVWHYDLGQQAAERHGWTAFTGQECGDSEEEWLASVHPEDREQVRSSSHAATRTGLPYTNEYRLRHHSGEWRWVQDHGVPLRDEDGRVTEWVGTVSDIHDRKRAEHEVWLAAHTDALTGVANRTLFQVRLDAAVMEARDQASSTGLVIVDLDRFKEVNDTLGHDAGDAVLRTVAERLKAVAPARATVARLGGDEFGVIVPGVLDVGVVADLAAGILAALDRPLLHGGREVECHASIGWSACPDHDPEASALLKNADIALYAAKSAGRGRALAFHAGMRAEMERRLTVLRRAKEALARDAVLPFFQPKISLETGRIDGFEALLRWTAEGGGLRTPGALQEALDDPELSVKLGARMLDRVVEQMRLWQEQGVPFGHVAVNVAAAEFHAGPYADRVMGALAGAGLDPAQLEIEVTERVLLDDGTSAVETALRALDQAGIAIALDDFGTGYASLTHLKTFPVSCLKIDRSFIQTLDSDEGSAAIVRAVLGLAHSIGIKVVAEGVETPSQCRFLKRAGCDVAQGFLFAKPMAGSRVPAFIRSIGWAPAGRTEAR